jgi:hypothetical protein
MIGSPYSLPRGRLYDLLYLYTHTHVHIHIHTYALSLSVSYALVVFVRAFHTPTPANCLRNTGAFRQYTVVQNSC